MRPRIAESLASCLLFALSAAPAGARETDRQQPIGIAADDSDIVMADDGDSRLIGNVAITQGTLKITAEAATLSRKAGDMVRVVFEGTPARLQQENDNGALMRAQGRRIDYDVTAESVVLSGDVVVDQAGDVLRGERITYDLKNGRLKAAGDGSGQGRIQMTIQPRQADAAAEGDAPEKVEGDRP